MDLKSIRLKLIFHVIISTTIVACKSDFEKAKLLQFRDINEVPMFKRYASLGGQVVGEADKHNNYSYAVEHIRDSVARQDVILFEKIIEQKGNPTPKFQIIDTICLRNIPGSLNLVYGCCHSKSTHRADFIIALVTNKFRYPDDVTRYYTEVTKAWQINIMRKKIDAITDTADIECFDENFPGCEDYNEE
jgi:hypothetical protein